MIHFNDENKFVQGYPHGGEYNLRIVATHEIGISIFIKSLYVSLYVMDFNFRTRSWSSAY